MNYLIIDCCKSQYAGERSSKGHKEIYHRLKKLKSTDHIEKPAQYQFAGDLQPYYQIHIDTTLTEEEVEKLLYKGNYDYVGVVTNDSRREE